MHAGGKMEDNGDEELPREREEEEGVPIERERGRLCLLKNRAG